MNLISHPLLRPDWNFYGPSDVERTFGAPVSIIGDYITVSKADYSCSQMYYHQDSLTQYKSSTVYAPAIIPADGVGNSNFTQDMAVRVSRFPNFLFPTQINSQNSLAQAFKSLNDNGVTVCKSTSPRGCELPS